MKRDLSKETITLVHIEALALEASIGIYEQEKKEKQTLLLDITLAIDCSEAIRLDKIDATVDYDKVVSLCKDVIDLRHYQLIESLAGTLMDKLILAFHPQGIKVTIKKKAILNAAYAAIIMQRGKI